MTNTATTATAQPPKVSALEKIKALKVQMETYKTEAIAELNEQISQKEQELGELRKLLGDLTGEGLDAEAGAQKRKRGPNKPKDAPVIEPVAAVDAPELDTASAQPAPVDADKAK